MVLTGDQIADVFAIVIGVQARRADVQVVQSLGGTPQVLAEYIWDHWMGEPDEPTQQQVLAAVNYVLQHPEQTQAQQARDALADYFSDRIPGSEPYDDDEATEYGSTPEEKAAGVGVDTGAFHSELQDGWPSIKSVDYGQEPGSLVTVEFEDGSRFHWSPLMKGINPDQVFAVYNGSDRRGDRAGGGARISTCRA